MKLVKWTDQIEYVVKRKFPGSNAPLPINPLSSRSSGGSNDHEAYQKRIVDIKAYKDELFKKTQAEVKSLYDEEYEKEINAIQLKTKLEEQSRFFNQPNANADFVHWSKAAHWSLDEAIALSFGKSPDIVSWSDVEKYTHVSPFAKEYAKRRDLALRAIPWKKLYDPVLPSIFLSWAMELNLPVPELLVSEVEKTGGTAINWRERYLELQKKYTAHLEKAVSEKSQTGQNKQQPAETYTFDSTPLIELVIKANVQFFSPRKSVDAKKPEVVDWVLENGKSLTPPVSTNIAEAIFTIIKPNDHSPRRKRQTNRLNQ